MKMNPSVSVIIPNFNGKKLLEENLPSVISALKYAVTDYEIIIPDDASTDDSISYLKKYYPQIIILPSVKNSGFSVNANKGVRAATKNLTLLLNTDIQLKEDYLPAQFKYFDKPDTFGVMGSIYSAGGKLIDAAKYPQWKCTTVNSTLNFSLKELQEGFWIPTYFLSGANALMESKKLKLLGGFSEIFSPFYMEDVDLSVRAWRMGWKCYYEPKAVCVHPVSATIRKENNPRKIKLISKRNKLIFHAIHLSGLRKLLWQSRMAISLLFRWFILDFDFYRYYRDYREMRNRIRLARKEFENPEPSYSFSQIINNIRQSVLRMPKKYF